MVSENHPQATNDASGEPRWYVLHCRSGAQHRLQARLQRRIEQKSLSEQVRQIVPVRGQPGQRGYILLEMIWDEATWAAIRETPGLTGFVGNDGRPVPIEQEMADKLLKHPAIPDQPPIGLYVGQRVQIVEGPYENFSGVVEQIDFERARLLVHIDFYGRRTPVELTYDQIEAEGDAS
jgi:transcriptional antiterminator NusG